MTNSVIMQEDNVVIEAKMVTAHVGVMPQTPEQLIPEHTLSEMRPERIGYRMRLLREAHGMKPAEISDLLGIERTYWSRWEGGKRAITEHGAALLVERFNVTLDFLILGKWERLPLEMAEKMRAVDRRIKSGEAA